MKNDIILVGARTPEMGQKLKNVLEQELFNVVDISVSGKEALRKVSINKPDLLVIDYEMGDMTGFQIAEIVINAHQCSVLLLTNEIQKEYAEQYFQYPYLICLNKPLNRSVLANAVEISLKSRRGIRSLEEEIGKLKDDIDTRKFVEKAKGLLMEKMGLNEEQAYNRIRKQSMDMQMSMKAVARVIIHTMKEET
ncbi:MAG: ANTAR domain-containing protein [Clostridia bacterium]